MSVSHGSTGEVPRLSLTVSFPGYAESSDATNTKACAAVPVRFPNCKSKRNPTPKGSISRPPPHNFGRISLLPYHILTELWYSHGRDVNAGSSRCGKRRQGSTRLGINGIVSVVPALWFSTFSCPLRNPFTHTPPRLPGFLLTINSFPNLLRVRWPQTSTYRRRHRKKQ